MTGDRELKLASEHHSIENMLPKESFDSSLTFPLERERDAAGKEIPGQAYWIKFNAEGKAAEGKLYMPISNTAETLVVFEPGLPGDSVKWMEEKHASAIVEHGMTLLVMRHLGTRLTPPLDRDQEEVAQNKYVHCQQRITKNPADYSGVIGNLDVPSNMETLAEEPATAINILGKKFPRIKVIGHSAGALFLADSIPRLDNDVQSKVTHFLSLSGHLGGQEYLNPKLTDFPGFLEYCRKYINMVNPSENLASMERVFKDVKATGLPESVMATMVHTKEDEYILPASAQAFQNFLGRGLWIDDQTQFEEEFHDLKNLRPETLLRLLNLPHRPQKKANITFINKEPKA